jgi:hypothetical protein
MRKMRNAYKNFGCKPGGKRPLRRPKCKWVDNIKKNVSEIGLHGMNWIHLAQDRDQWWAFVNTLINLQAP